MKNLVDYYSGADGAPKLVLTELRLGADPAMVLLFTADAQEARLHYVDDESVRSYVICPGAGCPICHTGGRPAQFHLLPCYEVESGTVKVLRIPDNRKPDGLGARLIPHMKGTDLTQKVILISRVQFAYAVVARDLGPLAQRGEQQIKAFLDDLEKGLRLDSAFKKMTPEELADVPKIAKRLEALGGWEPPRGGSEKIRDKSEAGGENPVDS